MITPTVIGLTLVLLSLGISLPVELQPPGQPIYVTPYEDEVTLFEMYPATGIVAHNYLAGEIFFGLSIGDLVDLVVERRRYQTQYQYKIVDVRQERIAGVERGGYYLGDGLVHEIYGVPGRLVLQTSVTVDGRDVALLFVIGELRGVDLHRRGKPPFLYD